MGLMNKIGSIIFTEAYAAIGYYLVDTQIVPRRDTIIRHGRYLQNALHIPTCACVFTETDPGIEDRDIRLSAKFIFTAFTIFGAGLLFALGRGSLWNIFSLAFMVVVPGCLLTLLWIGMAFSRRRRAKEAESVFCLRRGIDSRGRTMLRY